MDDYDNYEDENPTCNVANSLYLMSNTTAITKLNRPPPTANNKALHKLMKNKSEQQLKMNQKNQLADIDEEGDSKVGRKSILECPPGMDKESNDAYVIPSISINADLNEGKPQKQEVPTRPSKMRTKSSGSQQNQQQNQKISENNAGQATVRY